MMFRLKIILITFFLSILLVPSYVNANHLASVYNAYVEFKQKFPDLKNNLTIIINKVEKKEYDEALSFLQNTKQMINNFDFRIGLDELLNESELLIKSNDSVKSSNLLTKLKNSVESLEIYFDSSFISNKTNIPKNSTYLKSNLLELTVTPDGILDTGKSSNDDDSN